MATILTNKDIAQIFYEIADILELQEIQFKPSAYRKAARSIESYSKDLHAVYNEGSIKALKQIPGVGQHIAEKTEELLRTGKLKYYEKLKKQAPEGITALMQVPGIGPKKAVSLAKSLKIKSLEDLKRAVEQHRIQGLKGFGEKSEEDIEAGIGIVKKSAERIPLGIALPIAEDIKKYLEDSKYFKRVELAGSLRRMKETIGDFDILAISSGGKNTESHGTQNHRQLSHANHSHKQSSSENLEKAMKHFVSMPGVKRILASGATKSSILLNNNIQVDLRIVDESCFGAALQYFIGSKDHNIALRKIAISKGFKLSEYGLFGESRGKSGKQIAGKDEEELYKALGLQYIPPEMRENKGEIELAKLHKLPKLIERGDIIADLHIHTNYSDGNNSIAEMCHECINLGYKHVIISDHFYAVVNSLDEKSLLKQHAEIDKLNKHFEKEKKDFRILKGLEVEIKQDGSINAATSLLKSLDITTAAVHTDFKMPKPAFTKRLLAVLENEHVNILGHPMCRHFGSREPSEFDMQKIIDAAKKHNKALEINASIKRLDLNDTSARLANDSGVLLSIGTDAHAADQLHLMKYGLAIARRAWCEKRSILNTYSADKLLKMLKK